MAQYHKDGVQYISHYIPSSTIAFGNCNTYYHKKMPLRITNTKGANSMNIDKI